MRKYICILCAFLLVFISGCTSSYQRDTQPGMIKEIQLYEAILMKQEKKTFVLLLSQSNCLTCIDLNKELKEYIKEHNVQVYEVYLDKEQATQSENIKIIENDFKNFSSTPGLFYIQNGEQIDDLQPNQNGITRDAFDQWVIKNKIDEKDK